METALDVCLKCPHRKEELIKNRATVYYCSKAFLEMDKERNENLHKTDEEAPPVKNLRPKYTIAIHDSLTGKNWFSDFFEPPASCPYSLEQILWKQ